MTTIPKSIPTCAKRTCLLGLFLTFPILALPAATRYSDDFDGPLSAGWATSTSFSPTQADGVLTWDCRSVVKWTGQYLSLGAVYDFSAAPYLNVKLQTFDPCIMTMYFFTSDNQNFTTQVPLHPSSDFVNYLFDFSSVGAANLAKINAIQFTPNGATSGYSGFIKMEDLVIGADATLSAKRLARANALMDRVVPREAKGVRMRLDGIANASKISVTGPSNLVENIAAGAITNGVCIVTFDAKSGVAGSGLLTVTVEAAAGYVNNTFTVPLLIEDYLPPTLNALADVEVPVGRAETIRLSGLSDGNVASEESLLITATSSNGAVVASPLPAITRGPGSPFAELTFTALSPGSSNITVTVNDQKPANNTAAATFKVTAFQAWNEAPTLDALADLELFLSDGPQQIELTGLSDGDGQGQNLTVTAQAADPTLFSGLSVEYTTGATGILHLTPAAVAGTTTVTVTVTDNGAASGNNGNRSFSRTFQVTTRLTLPDTLVGDMAGGRDQWRAEAPLVLSWVKEGAEDVLVVTYAGKSTWNGLWWDHPDVNMSEYPVVAFDFKPSSSGQVKMFVWDNIDDPEDRHYNTGHTIVKTVVANQWTSLTYDFRAAGAMQNSKGTALNASWITACLFNFHAPNLEWPFTNIDGNYRIKNIRLGKAALPDNVIYTTLDDIADRYHFGGPEWPIVKLTGITNGTKSSGGVTLTVESTNPAVTAELSVSLVAANGTATLTYLTPAGAGTATVSVTAYAPGATPVTKTFTVTVLSSDPTGASTVAMDRTVNYQTIHGFGCFSNSPAWVDEYTQEMGGSAMRVGLIGNQLELLNDNNDPLVLNRAALNYDCFDWDYYRRLKERGVESFILTSWSPPAWMKDNLAEGYFMASVGTDTDAVDNRLAYDKYEEFAESMVAAYRLFQEECGIDLAGIGLQNEPVFFEPYPSAILDPEHFVELIKVTGRRFAAEGIDCPLYMPEQVFSQGANSMADYINTLNTDPEAQQYCQVIATHGYAADGVGGGQPNFSAWTTMYNQAQGGGTAKQLWMTETYPEYNSYSDALNYAIFLYGALEFGQINLWTSWSYDGQFRKSGVPTKSLYTFSQYAKFVRPTAKRIKTTGPGGQLYVTSYVNGPAHGGNLVSVLTNESATVQRIKLTLAGGFLPPVFRMYRTDAKANRLDEGSFPANGVIFLPPRSVVTLVGEDLNNPPQITVGLAVSNPNPVTQTTLRLTATDSDTAVLDYAWTLLSGPAGAIVTFESGDATSGPAGQEATNLAIFHQAGQYSFQVVVSDGSRTVLSQSVTVNVAAQATALVLNPMTADVQATTTQTFNASVRDQFDAPMALDIQWTTGRGTLLNSVGASSTYTAPAQLGPDTVTATSGTFSETANLVIIEKNTRPTVTTKPTLPAAEVGQPWQLQLSSRDGNGTIVWSVDPTSTLPDGFTLSTDGMLAGTPTTAGKYDFIINATDADSEFDGERFTLNVSGPAGDYLWDLTALGDNPSGLLTDTWCGDVYVDKTVYPWVWHVQHGWMYVMGTDDTFAWFYTLDVGFLGTGKDLYPLLYSIKRTAWVYYYPGTTQPRYFYDFTTQADFAEENF